MNEFLVRVRPLPDGGFEATCQPTQATHESTAPYTVRSLSISDGQGATPLAAMIAALSPSGLKQAEAAIKRVWPELPADVIVAIVLAALANSQVSDSDYERHILTTPGVPEAANQVHQLIEEWRHNVQAFECPDCGQTGMHAQTCGMFPGAPVEHGNRVRNSTEEASMTDSLDVTVYVCPVCLTVGGRHDSCPHYESGSVGMVWYTRQPATIAVRPKGWTPVLDSLESPKQVQGTTATEAGQ